MAADRDDPAGCGRALMRRTPIAALATALAGDGWPYASLVLVAVDHDASPLLLLSSLAEHSRNIAREPRVSLLFDGTGEREDPLSGARLTVLGRAAETADPRHRARFLARHPSAAAYAGFTDFALYRVAVERAHLVAGFGRIDWIEAGDLLLDTRPASALAEREGDIVTHMNEDHADALTLYATALLGEDGDGWVMTGCDPEGFDLRLGGRVARLAFETPVNDAQAAREALVALAAKARGAP